MAVTREEHLAWCKERAFEYLEKGDLKNAWTSLVTDLSAHEGTAGHSAVFLGNTLLFAGKLSTQGEMREFIEGVS